MKKVIDYLYEFDNRLISPIWGGEKDFEFLCLGYLDFAKAIGFDLCRINDNLMKVVDNALPDEDSLIKIEEKNYFDLAILDNEINNLLKLKKSLKVPVGGGCFGPLTVASAIFGVERMNKLIIKNPLFVQNLASYITKHMVKLAIEEEKHGADFFWIAEPVASMVSYKIFNKFCGQYIKNIFGAIKVPGFLHVCGKTLKHTKGLLETGAQVLSIDYVTDIEKCIRIVPEDVVIMGNLNPMMLRFNSEEEIVEETLKINEICKNYKNFIFSTGCMLPSNTPKKNVEVMINTTRKYKIWNNNDYKYIRKLINANLACDAENIVNLRKEIKDEKLVQIAADEALLISKYTEEYL